MHKTGFVLCCALVAAMFAVPTVHAQMANDAMVKKGKSLFVNRGCGGCHAIGKKMAGPDLAGVAKRRSREWLGRWLKDTEGMLQSDSIAMALLAEHKGIKMPSQKLGDADVDALLAYIASEESKMSMKK